MKTILQLSAFLFIANISYGQNWKYIRPSNTGLGGDTYICLEVDRCGNKWTGGFLPFWSEGSLTRFDDSVFTNWSNFENYLPADRVYGVAFDSNDEVWAATNGLGNNVAHGGLVHYDGQTWTQYTTANTPLPEDDLRGVVVDHNDNIWVTFWNTGAGVGGVAKFDHTTWTIYTPSNSSLPTYRVSDIDVDAQNNIWVGTDLGLAKFDGTSWTTFTDTNSGLSGYDIFDVEFDESTNKLYVATGISIDIFDGTNWSHINSSNSPVASTALYEVDAKGSDIIIGTLGGTYLCYVFHSGVWTSHPEQDHCYDVRIDLQNNFWLCGNGYIEKFDGNSWIQYNGKNTGLTSMFNDDIYVDSKNRVWFSSNDNGGINVFDCRTWQDYNPYNAGLWPQPITYTGSAKGVTEDDTGDIWMVFSGALGGVVQVPQGNINNPSAWTVWDNTNSGVSLQFLSRTAADHSGNVWFGYEDACSVSKYNHASNSWTNYNLYQLGQITCGAGSGINSIRVDDSSNVWICGLAGLTKYDQSAWTFYSHLNTPLQGEVMDIAFTPNGKWIATETGLFFYNDTSWTKYDTTNTPMAANFCSSVIVDGNGIIWVASSQSIPAAGSLTSFDGNTWTSYTISNSGLQENFINRLALDTLGNIWVLSVTHGASIFNPSGVVGFDCIDKKLTSCSVTGIERPEVNLNSLNAFPNPSDDFCKIKFISKNSSHVHLTVFNVSGKITDEQEYAVKSGENEIVINTKEYSSGIYFGKLLLDGNLYQIKLSVMR